MPAAFGRRALNWAGEMVACIPLGLVITALLKTVGFFGSGPIIKHAAEAPALVAAVGLYAIILYAMFSFAARAGREGDLDEPFNGAMDFAVHLYFVAPAKLFARGVVWALFLFVAFGVALGIARMFPGQHI